MTKNNLRGLGISNKLKFKTASTFFVKICIFVV